MRWPKNRIKLLTQPSGSYVCGQSSVAMLLGISIKGACGLFGHRQATTHHNVKTVLARQGWYLDQPVLIQNRVIRGTDEIRRFSAKCPDGFLITEGPRGYHCSLVKAGRLYDPGTGTLKKHSVEAFYKLTSIADTALDHLNWCLELD